MAKRMKLWVAGALLLAVGGTVVASNMGFKFVPNLNQAGIYFTLSLPYNQNYTNADAVYDDLNLACPQGVNAHAIDKIKVSAGGNTHDTWFGTTGTNFLLATGEGYGVIPSVSCTTWVVVGSHNPAFVKNFLLPSNYYFTSIPYHTTATVAHDLWTSIPNVDNVDRIKPTAAGNQHETWFGTTGTNFPVKVGDAYGVVVKTPGNVSWTPSHY